ncbi:MAG: hypothetical protein R6V06_00555 [Kiritimatiellia bacterium]
MAGKKTEKRRFTSANATNVFVGGEKYGSKLAWRLDVERSVDLDSGQVSSKFFFKRRGHHPVSRKNKLFRYISAGGMRQLKRTTVDDLVEFRKRRFLFFMALLALFWVVFYIFPGV